MRRFLIGAPRRGQNKIQSTGLTERSVWIPYSGYDFMSMLNAPSPAIEFKVEVVAFK